jgi:hypothetical protein
LCCHSDELGVAGSIDPAGPAVARVVVIDATGEASSLSPNRFGNFFRHFPMTPPIRAVVVGPDGRARAMQDGAPHGDCNACHRTGGAASPIHGP